jgi:amino acid transporter
MGWLSEGTSYDGWFSTTATCLGSLFVAFMASRAPRLSQRLINILTWSKLMALGSIILGGFMYLSSPKSPFVANLTAKNDVLSSDFKTIFTAIATAMNAGLWSFDGWNNLNMVAGDLKNPKRNLPLSIWISVSAVLTLYSVTLLAYYCVIPRHDFVSEKITKSGTVGTLFGEILSAAAFGDPKWKWIGSSIISLFVMGSTFSAALSSMVTSSEVILLSAENGNIPAPFGRLHPKWKTAANAYALQGVLAVLLAVAFNEKLLTVYTFPVWIFYALCASVVLIMRFEAPELERPYRVFISTPILFLVACAILVASTALAEPWEVMASFAIVLAGVPVYYWIRSRSK